MTVAAMCSIHSPWPVWPQPQFKPATWCLVQGFQATCAYSPESSSSAFPTPVGTSHCQQCSLALLCSLRGSVLRMCSGSWSPSPCLAWTLLGATANHFHLFPCRCVPAGTLNPGSWGLCWDGCHKGPEHGPRMATGPPLLPKPPTCAPFGQGHHWEATSWHFAIRKLLSALEVSASDLRQEGN